jgi:hypothetical protein
MRGVEARSKIPRFKEYKRPKQAEDFAKRLGVQTVNYGGRVDIANLVNRALHEVAGHGVPMPTSVLVRPFDQEDDDQNEIAYYTPGLTGGPGEMVINADHAFWVDPVQVARKAREEREFSTDSSLHPVMHELGELALHQSVGDAGYESTSRTYQRDEDDFQQEDLRHVYEILGDRATANHSEFVAEVFAAMQLGRADELKQHGEIMRMYERYGGTGIRQYDP